MKRLQFCLMLLSLLLLSLGAFAQIQNGQFTGTVTDPSGAAIANAKVTVTNVGTDLAIDTTTSSTGLYILRELPVGTYKIVAEAPGFKTTTNTNLTLNAGTIQRVDFKMQLGQTREVIEVTGAAAAVNTEDSKMATTVTATQVANLPLNGRNIYDLMLLSPGAINNGVGGDKGKTSEAGPTTIVNGTRQNFNGFLINGVSNKDLSGGPNNTPIEDSIQEFQQLTLNMSSQYGNSAGSVTNLITKGGTNSWHGSAWEFLRNDKLDANNFFLNHDGVDRPPLRFNQFGATFGGPIIRDKLFFFASYQGDRFTTVQPPTPVEQESPDFRAAVDAFAPNSVAALLFNNFPPLSAGTTPTSFNDYPGTLPGGVAGDFTNWLCPDNNNAALAARFQSFFGVTPADVANATAAGCSTPLTVQSSAVGLNRNSPSCKAA